MKKPIFFVDFLKLLDANMPIYSVLDQVGIDYNPQKKAQLITCPFHADSTPSAKIYPDSNSIFCFAENKRFGIFNLLRLKASAKEIIAWGEVLFQVKVMPGKSLLTEKPDKVQISSKFDVTVEWEQFLAFAESKLIEQQTEQA